MNEETYVESRFDTLVRFWAKHNARVHLAMTLFWIMMLIPTFLWLRHSILWVAFMSAYALMVGHFSSFEAALSKGVDDPTHTKLNAIADALADFMEEYHHQLSHSDNCEDEERLEDAHRIQEDIRDLRQAVGLEEREPLI